MRCSKCAHWRPVLAEQNAALNRAMSGHAKEWGQCEFGHSRMYVDLPEETRGGRAALLTAGTFSCAEMVRVRGKREAIGA